MVLDHHHPGTLLCGLLHRWNDTKELHVGQFILDLLPQGNWNITWGVESKWFCIRFQLYDIAVTLECS